MVEFVAQEGNPGSEHRKLHFQSGRGQTGPVPVLVLELIASHSLKETTAPRHLPSAYYMWLSVAESGVDSLIFEDGVVSNLEQKRYSVCNLQRP